MAGKESCFVVGPIGAEGTDTRIHADWLYDGIIKPVFKEFPNFAEPVRADRIAQPGMITTQVIELLLDSKLVIADLSLLNPNAFYEIGIRHMAQKPVIHMQLKSEAPPFDVNGYRAIRFSVRHPGDLLEAQRELSEQVKSAIAEDHRVENPVTHARGQIRIKEEATPKEKVLIDQLAELSARIGALEKFDMRTSGAEVSRREANLDIFHSRTKPGFHGELLDIFGSRLQWVETQPSGKGERSRGYVEVSGLPYSQLVEFEERVARLPGVVRVSLMPF